MNIENLIINYTISFFAGIVGAMAVIYTTQTNTKFGSIFRLLIFKMYFVGLLCVLIVSCMFLFGRFWII